MSRDDFLSRWSRRKAESKATPEAGRDVPTAGVVPAQAGTQVPQQTQEGAPLPPVESLTPESDFTPFMKTDVDPGVKREALKALFRDPRFNVMDGLDVYIDDYSKPDPLPPEWLAQMNQMKRLGAYVEPVEEEAGEGARQGDESASEAPAELPKAMQDQPVAFPENEAPVDTPAALSREPDDGDAAPKPQ